MWILSHWRERQISHDACPLRGLTVAMAADSKSASNVQQKCFGTKKCKLEWGLWNPLARRLWDWPFPQKGRKCLRSIFGRKDSHKRDLKRKILRPMPYSVHDGLKLLTACSEELAFLCVEYPTGESGLQGSWSHLMNKPKAHPSQKRLLTDNRLSQTTILRISFEPPGIWKDDCLESVFFSQRKRSARKSEMFKPLLRTHFAKVNGKTALRGYWLRRDDLFDLEKPGRGTYDREIPERPRGEKPWNDRDIPPYGREIPWKNGKFTLRSVKKPYVRENPKAVKKC